MNFKKWYIMEVGTGTSSVAVFSRPIFGGPVSRTWPSMLGCEPEHKKSHNKKHKKKKED